MTDTLCEDLKSAGPVTLVQVAATIAAILLGDMRYVNGKRDARRGCIVVCDGVCSVRTGEVLYATMIGYAC
jgi:hypothetical protein